MRVLDAFRPRGATWLGQVISFPSGPSGGPSKTHLLPGGGVPRVHRARSPVPPRLPRFATPRSVHQFAAVAADAYPSRRPPNVWSPGAPALPGPCYWLVTREPLALARWLPGLGVGAWCSAPLLPWRVQCPVSVCVALPAGLGGSGWCLVLCLPRFPLPAPRVPRCVWRSVPSGCPLCSLAGTPFHAVCAFRELGPVALPVVPACPLFCVCARAPAVSAPPPPPWVVWRAHLARSRRSALVGPFHAVRARPRVLPRSLALSGVLGGGRPGPGSPLPGLGLCAPRGVGLRIRGVPVPGGGVGGGVAGAPRPPFVRPGGASGAGGCSASFRPSAFPGKATKRVSLALFWSWRAWPPYRSGLCSPAFSGHGPCGVLAHWRGFACSPRFPWEPAAGAGGRAVLRPFSRAPRSHRGERGPSPLPRGGGGRRPCCLRTGGGGSGGGPAAASLLPLWGAVRGFLPCPSSRRRRIPPRCARSVGAAGLPRAPGAACLAGGGGGGGAARGLLPRGPLQTRNLPLPSPSGQHCGCHEALVLGGAAPILFRCAAAAAPGRGPRTALARWCGLAHRPRPPRVQAAGGAGARGVQVELRPPPRVAVPSGGGRASLRLRGAEGSALLRPSSRGGGAAPLPPAPPPRRASACHPSPRGILVLWASLGGRGRRARPGRPPTGLCGGGGGGGGRGGVISSPRFAPPPSPGQPLRGPLRLRRPLSVGSGWGGSVRVVHSGRSPQPRCPPPFGCSGLPGGLRGRCLTGLPPSALGPEGGGERERGGPLVPWRRPQTAAGGPPGSSGHGGPAVGWGVALFPRPSLPCESRTLVQALAGVPCSPRRRCAALAGWGRP